MWSVLGEIELFVNGRSIILAKGLMLRKTSDSYAQGMHCQTFFGGKLAQVNVARRNLILCAFCIMNAGHGEDWASPADQYIWFADISGAIIR
jgi:hypothetical protein